MFKRNIKKEEKKINTNSIYKIDKGRKKLKKRNRTNKAVQQKKVRK